MSRKQLSRLILTTLIVAIILTTSIAEGRPIKPKKPSPSKTTYAVGTSDHIGDWETNPLYWERLGDLDVEWIRTTAQGTTEGGRSQRFVKRLDEEGYKVLLIFNQKIAGWGEGGWIPMEDLDQWRNTVRDGLAIYGPYIDAIEVWGEPDLPVYSLGYQDGSPEHYYNMLKVAYEEIKAYNSEIRVVGGSVATMRNSETVPGDHYGGYFLQRIVDLGAREYCDAFSIHIYNWFLNGINGLDSADDVYLRAKSIVKKPVWVSEMGAKVTEDQGSQLRVWFDELEAVKCPFIGVYHFNSGPCGLTSGSDFSINDGYYVLQEKLVKGKIKR